jgi:hypothetical protein
VRSADDQADTAANSASKSGAMWTPTIRLGFVSIAARAGIVNLAVNDLRVKGE